jgi:TolA-binding protein
MDYHLVLGEKYKHRSEWARALEYYNNVISRAGEDDSYELEQALIGVADIFCEQGKFMEAVSSYSEFLNRFPDSESVEDAARKIPYCLAQDGQLEEAREQFRQYLDRYPNGLYHDWAKDKLEELNRFSETGS